jgi:hypothetical protein
LTIKDVKNLDANSLPSSGYVIINACNAGTGSNSIASHLANQLNVNVYAPNSGMSFSNKSDSLSGLKIHPSKGPTYMIPEAGKILEFKPKK